uniref:Uncharacterized protein n=1 Tax=Anguilla anguilla TaxID=7936 RepID=A0A0E9SQF5_ANGAN
MQCTPRSFTPRFPQIIYTQISTSPTEISLAQK